MDSIIFFLILRKSKGLVFVSFPLRLWWRLGSCHDVHLSYLGILPAINGLQKSALASSLLMGRTQVPTQGKAKELDYLLDLCG